ncbi:MAG: alpha-2-macroglobulin family protein, partial [Thermoanaerobaculia bacterium]|nr:alpha-2-macroglobulin family protein [Thermoanaerobaculia bacterium]
EEAVFSPQGFESFQFGDDERKFDSRELLETRGNLTAEGTAAVTVPLPTDLDAPSSLRAVVTARVQEQGGRGVSARAAYAVHPWPRYVGLKRSSDGWAEPNKDEAFEFAVVAPDGAAARAPSLRAELWEVRWNTVLRRTEQGGFRYETTRDPRLVSSQNLASPGARGSFSFRAAKPGSYRVVVTDPTGRAASAVNFYVSGWGYAPWAVENPNRLELALDKDEYAPGDVATVQVRAPFAGKLFVTVERNQVEWTEIHTMTGNTAAIRIPIRGEYRPNAFVTATLVRAVDELTAGSSARAFGAVPLPVDRNANRLEPVIEAPEESRSAREVTFGVLTEPGATVTLSAVDEGILQLIGQELPQPFDFFYRQLGLTVTTFDTFRYLLPEVDPVGTAKAGGGDGLMAKGASMRTESLRRVEPVSYWSGPLVADATGRATFKVQLPEEFQGSLRLTAVAIDGKRFGVSRDDTRVRDPLVLLPTAPRVLSFGEELSVPVTVRNDTGRAGTFRVALGVEGPATAQSASTDLEVPDAAERTAYLGLTTGETSGAVRLRITAEGNGERAKSTIVVPVRPDLPAAAESQAVAVAGRSMAIPLANPDRYRPETLRREVRIGTLPLVQFTGQLSNLLQYPYGCLEQTVSTAFPLLYLGELARQLEPDLFTKEKGRPDPEVLVADAVRSVALHQTYDGDFTLWPEMERPQLWASVYATHFLVEAQRAGHEVPAGLLERALEAVARKIQSKDTYGRAELQRTAYGLFVLARAGRPELGTMDYLREKQAATLPTEARALLAAAYAAAGNPAAPRQLLAGLGEIETIERQTGENFESTLRNRALVTLAYLDADPKSPELPRLVDRLAREAGQVTGWWTTQETAWVFLALGQFAQSQAAKGPFAGTLWVGDKKVGRFSSDKPAAFLDIAGTAPLRLEMDGAYADGSAYASVLVRGVPTDGAYRPASAGLEVTREVVDRDGRAVDLDSVQQGDLLVIKTAVRSVAGPVENVAIVNLLPSGLEVENPRLETTESLPWATGTALSPDATDLRDDRIVLFADLGTEWRTFYALVRAVSPGKFRLPPVQAEAMYNPALFASGERGTVEVQVRP